MKVKLQDLRELRHRIVTDFDGIVPEILRNTMREVEYRLDGVRPTYVVHIKPEINHLAVWTNPHYSQGLAFSPEVDSGSGCDNRRERVRAGDQSCTHTHCYTVTVADTHIDLYSSHDLWPDCCPIDPIIQCYCLTFENNPSSEYQSMCGTATPLSEHRGIVMLMMAKSCHWRIKSIMIR
ncbi:hypothetical protein J6590_025560 [Homalodisca vitripennis]|nr:hypothetical protein J6590_025560 [Homalodisca vitripennis]